MPAAPAIPATGELIAATARRYDGQGYVYGGTASAPGRWDCSSFISFVLGHDLGMALPGGSWGEAAMPPNVHGPVVLDYVQWPGADPVPSGQQAAGDLVCWPGVGGNGHIGVVQAANKMTSALDPQYGTLTSPIQGWGPSPHFVFRRVKGTGQPPTPGPGSSGSDTAIAVLAGLAVGAGVAAVMLTLAAAAAAGVTWLALRTMRPR